MIFLIFPRRKPGPSSTPRSTVKIGSKKSRIKTQLLLRLTGLGRWDNLAASKKQFPTTRVKMLLKNRKQRFRTKLMQPPREELPKRINLNKMAS